MRCDLVKELQGAAFRRLTGVRRSTFEDLVVVLFAVKCKPKAAGQAQHALHRRPAFDDARILAGIRTYFHIGQTYGISESAAYRNIKWRENTLAKSKVFRLPGRKAVAASERVFDVVLIDATETPIERPKKTKALLFGQEEAAHAENPARRRKIDTPHSLPRARKRTATRLPAVQNIEGAAAS